LLFWLSLASTGSAVYLAATDAIWFAGYFAFTATYNFVLVYAFPDKEEDAAPNEYSRMIDQLSRMGSQLTELSAFLEREGERVTDTENTIKRLRDEKSQLEPIVTTERETVDAILAAYSVRIRSSVWKDRIFGFTLGVLASLIATTIFELIRD
jgi:hypothetical protein